MAGGGQSGMGGPSGGGFGGGQGGFGGANTPAVGLGNTGGSRIGFSSGMGGFGGGRGGYGNFMQNFGGRPGGGMMFGGMQPAPGGGFFGGRGGATPGGYLNSFSPFKPAVMPPPVSSDVMPPGFGMPPPAGLTVEPGPVGTGEYTGGFGNSKDGSGLNMPPPAGLPVMPPGLDSSFPITPLQPTVPSGVPPPAGLTVEPGFGMPGGMPPGYFDGFPPGTSGIPEMQYGPAFYGPGYSGGAGLPQTPGLPPGQTIIDFMTPEEKAEALAQRGAAYIPPGGFGNSKDGSGLNMPPPAGLPVMSSQDLNLTTGLPSQMGTAQTGAMPTNQFMSQYGGGMGVVSDMTREQSAQTRPDAGNFQLASYQPAITPPSYPSYTPPIGGKIPNSDEGGRSYNVDPGFNEGTISVSKLPPDLAGTMGRPRGYAPPRGPVPPSPLQTGGRSGPFIPTGNLPTASLPNPRTPQTGGVIGPSVPQQKPWWSRSMNTTMNRITPTARRGFAEGGIASLRYAEGGPARDERGFLLNPVYDEYGFDQEGNTRFGRDPNQHFELEKLIPGGTPRSAQEAYDLTLKKGMSPEYKAWFDSLPQHLKTYVPPPATGPNDPRWLSLAGSEQSAFERYGNENPFAKGAKTKQMTKAAGPAKMMGDSKMRGSNWLGRQAQPTQKTMAAPPPAAPTAPTAPTAPAAQYQDIPLAVNQNMSNMPTSAPPPGPMAPPPAPMMPPSQQTGGFSLQDYINSMQIPEAARRRAAKSDMAKRIASRIAASDKGIAGLKK